MADPSEKESLVDVQMDDEDGNVMDDLKFQDFSKDNTIGQNDLNAEGAIGGPQQSVPSNISSSYSLADYNSDDEEGDKRELLAGTKKQPPFWTFEYYMRFFDVDTQQVLGRILGSMVPLYKRNYLISQIRPNPDLYGPFWVCATLVFTTAIAGNLAAYLQSAGDHTWKYDFHKVTLAAAAIYTYAWLVPTALWGTLIWRGSHAGYSFLEIICVYGYSLAIYIPISILWVAPFETLRWVLVMVGMMLSGTVLLLTFWPAVEDDDKKIAGLIMAGIFILHGLLSLGFKMYFFHSSPEAAAPHAHMTNGNSTSSVST